MLTAPPFTVDEFLRAANEGLQIPMNRPQRRIKPRASGLGDCARKTGAMMHNVPVTNPDRPDAVLTSEQGRMFEDISAKVVEKLGYVVVNRQVELPADFFSTGHPDGQLIYRKDAEWIEPEIYSGDSRGGTTGAWTLLPGKTGRLDDGKIWGFEHKHLGRWAYEKVFKVGLVEAEPGYIVQTTQYAAGLGWDAVLVLCVAQDASSTRSDATRNLKSKNPAIRWAHIIGWNPKVQIYALDAEQLKYALLPRLQQRAEALTVVENPADIIPEYNPFDTSKDVPVFHSDGSYEFIQGPDFPCSHCGWLDWCKTIGPGSITIPSLPFQMTGEDE